jgi:thiamine kinase-like enzyme
MVCRGTLMKAMINNKGDDAYFDRLLSYFQLQFYEKIIRMVAIRHSVFYVKTEKNTYIIKGYNSNSKLKLQEAFTATLRKEGFLKTYHFLSSPVKEPLFFEETYFGIIEYIVPNKTAFSYHSQKNREEGLELLEQFHLVTATFEARYHSLLPKAHLFKKWCERSKIFLGNLPFLNYFIHEPVLSEMVSWAEWSLAGMEKIRGNYSHQPFVILHGDVAHHNFLRNSHGILHLIDFDLISIGPHSLDFLQYANRILPFIDWSFGRLESHQQIQRFLQDDSFLFALAFPADIFREWNRIIREKTFDDHLKMKQVMDLTMGQYHARKQFIDHLKRKVT